MTEPTVGELLAALDRSHDALVGLLAGKGADALTAPSYAREWSIAQVASHLGSGAEIFGLLVAAGAAGEPAPGGDVFGEIWGRWDAKTPVVQAADALTADGAFQDKVRALAAEVIQGWELDVFGGTQTLGAVLRMRFAEVSLHSWDIAVATDPGAVLPSDATKIVVDNLAAIAGYTGRAWTGPDVLLVTTEPEREVLLRARGAGLELVPAPAGASLPATVRLPAESLIRLVYGRLDADHTPDEVQADGVTLDALRQALPGV